jgi:uncharacterized membrane protein
VASSTDVDSVLQIYTSYLTGQKRLSRTETGRRIKWLKEFGLSVCARKTIYDTSVRDIVIYFAEWAEKFEDPDEWYDRYKVIERFFDDLVDMQVLETNPVKGIYDDTDIEPDLTEDAGPSESLAPVNWLRQDHPLY